eukprot:tig00021244_g19592.t1
MPTVGLNSTGRSDWNGSDNLHVPGYGGHVSMLRGVSDIGRTYGHGQVFARSTRPWQIERTSLPMDASEERCWGPIVSWSQKVAEQEAMQKAQLEAEAQARSEEIARRTRAAQEAALRRGPVYLTRTTARVSAPRPRSASATRPRPLGAYLNVNGAQPRTPQPGPNPFGRRFTPREEPWEAVHGTGGRPQTPTATAAAAHAHHHHADGADEQRPPTINGRPRTADGRPQSACGMRPFSAAGKIARSDPWALNHTGHALHEHEQYEEPSPKALCPWDRISGYGGHVPGVSTTFGLSNIHAQHDARKAASRHIEESLGASLRPRSASVTRSRGGLF